MLYISKSRKLLIIFQSVVRGVLTRRNTEARMSSALLKPSSLVAELSEASTQEGNFHGNY
jgi:hypothetical protein